MAASKQSRALLMALQHKKDVKDVTPLINKETAKAADIYYNMKPLFWALSYGASADVLKLLLDSYPEAAAEAHEAEGWTPLHYAEKLDLEAVKLLISKCPGAAQAKDSQGRLPLHWAAEHNAPVATAKALVEAYDQAPFIKDNLGRLPIKLAADHGAGDELMDYLAGLNPEGAAALPVPPPADLLPICLLFPGWGSQCKNMLANTKDLPAVQDMLKQAQAVLGYDLLKVCMEGPMEDQVHVLPALFIAGLASMERLRLQKADAVQRAQVVCGVSLGEYTALCAAGVFSFKDGLELVKEMADASVESAEKTPQAAMSVVGLDETRLLSLCEQAQKKHPGEFCGIASSTFRKGYQVSGHLGAVQECHKLCEGAKAKQVRLIKGLSAIHSPLMEPVRRRMEAKFQQVLPRMKRPRCQVYLSGSCRAADWETHPTAIVDLMLQSLTGPLRFQETVEVIVEDGLREFWECGPQKMLKNYMKRIDAGSSAKMISVDS